MDPFSLIAMGAGKLGGVIAQSIQARQEQKRIKKQQKAIDRGVQEMKDRAKILRTEELRTRSGITDEISGRMLASQEQATRGLQEAGVRAVLGGATAQSQAGLGNMLGLRQNLIEQEQARSQAVVEDKQRMDRDLQSITQQEVAGAREAQAESAAVRTQAIQGAVSAGGELLTSGLAAAVPLYTKGRQGRMAGKAMEGFQNLSPKDKSSFIQNLESQGIYKTAEGFEGIDMPQLTDIFANTATKNLKQFIDFQMPEGGAAPSPVVFDPNTPFQFQKFEVMKNAFSDPNVAMQNRFNLITGTGAPTISTSDLNTENLTAGENTVDSKLFEDFLAKYITSNPEFLNSLIAPK
tara:strand:- start:3147 stop:4196 length:1050 start_codon:yes stop_codon:yes gene_type:complete